MKGRNEIRKKTQPSMGNEQERKKKRTPSRQNYLEGQTKFHSQTKGFLSFPMNLSHSLALSDSLSLMPGEPFKLYSALPQSSECMSHMPHSHDIVGPGTARGTSHSQGLLLCIAHMALEPVGQGERG